MLSYLHKYHAGNFTDLHKQLALTAILTALKEKAKPFSMIDTHGGEGFYRQGNENAKNFRELQSGLAPFFNQIEGIIQKEDVPELIQDYALFLKKHNPDKRLTHVPGSGLLLSEYLNKEVKLTICEKHPTVFEQLQANFLPLPSTLSLLKTDGYQATKALLPPKEKRGLIFIDPSYETKQEYEQLTECLTQAIKRFATGIYVIWYPILNNRSKEGVDWLIRKIGQLPIQSFWQHEWYLEPGLNPENSGFHALQGSGLLCIQAPWQTDNHLNLSFDWLNSHLFPGRKCKAIWLKEPN